MCKLGFGVLRRSTACIHAGVRLLPGFRLV